MLLASSSKNGLLELSKRPNDCVHLPRWLVRRLPLERCHAAAIRCNGWFG
jgi:hypothetical protein